MALQRSPGGRSAARLIAGIVVLAAMSGCGPGESSAESGASPPAPPRTIGNVGATEHDERLATLACRYIETTIREQRAGGTVFMAPDATDEQVAAVRSVLGADREIGDLQYIDRAGAWEQARTVFADEPALLSAMSPEMLPTNFAFSLPLVEGKAHEPESLAGVRGMSGVKEVKAVRSLTCTDADAVMIAAHRRFVENRFGDGEVAVYIHPARVDAVPMLRDRLLAMPSVRGIVFVSQDDALPELRCLAWDDPDVTKFGRDDAPVTFVLDLGDDASVASEVALSIQSLGGVESVAIRSTDAEIVMDSVNAVREGRHPAGEPDCPTKGQRIR